MGIRELNTTSVSPSPHILYEKVTPPALPARYLSRGRLLCAVTESLSCGSATIISGRAGTGKTSLAVEFSRSAGRVTAWYKVDAADGDLSVFFKYLVESIAGQRLGFGEQMAVLGTESFGAEDVPLMVESFVNELLQRDEPLLIVLDDLHLVYDEAWVAPFFRRLLPLLPREVHVMLIGRGLPPTPLWRMRSKQALRVIEESALAFTLREAEDWSDRYGLPSEAMLAAWAETKGRVGPFVEKARAAAGLDAGDCLFARGREHRQAKHLSLVRRFAS
ncbi:MAG TPA: AAA family ATPase [Pyrinomonadaceae bacterium]|nr:AAA family ATPase [Pyrinomonadaceae bacterium]